MAESTRQTTCGHYPYCAKGLCRKCYMAARRPKKGRVPPSTTCGHSAPHKAKGLCDKCYKAAWRKAQPPKPPKLPRPPRPTTCGHYPHAAGGLCMKCYKVAWRAANPEKSKGSTKTPTTCGHPHHSGKGLCRKCYAAADYAANGEKRRAGQLVYASAHREANRQRTREWYRANPDRAKEAARAWHRANREQSRILATRYRARKKAADPDLTADEWLAILAEHDNCCAYCGVRGVPLDMEHMTPLSRGGKHTAANIVPACKPCNGRKWTKTALEFAGWSIPPRRVSGESG